MAVPACDWSIFVRSSLSLDLPLPLIELIHSVDLSFSHFVITLFASLLKELMHPDGLAVEWRRKLATFLKGYSLDSLFNEYSFLWIIINKINIRQSDKNIILVNIEHLFMKFSNISTHDKLLCEKIGAKTESILGMREISTGANNFWTHTLLSRRASWGIIWDAVAQH